MINKSLDLVMRINRETELCASFEHLGHSGYVKVDIAKGKKNPIFLDYVYGWQSSVDGTGEFHIDDLKKQRIVYEELLSYLPKEKRPVTTPVEEKIIYHTILPQKEDF